LEDLLVDLEKLLTLFDDGVQFLTSFVDFSAIVFKKIRFLPIYYFFCASILIVLEDFGFLFDIVSKIDVLVILEFALFDNICSFVLRISHFEVSLDRFDLL
jgi:hypothetical protein